MINIEVFASNLLKRDKKSYKNTDIYYIWHLIIVEVDGHIKEKNGGKYLVYDSTDENREVLEKYAEL